MPGDLLGECGCTYDTFEYIFQIEHILDKCLKESCWLVSDQHFSSNDNSKMLLSERYHQNNQVVLGSTGMNGLNESL